MSEKTRIESYKDLEVWRRSIDLVKAIYKMTKSLPSDEQYGLVSQMRRSAVSVPSNIAEGKTRRGRREFIKFLFISLASCAELETQIIICKELSYVSPGMTEESMERIDHIARMLRNLIKGLQGIRGGQ